MKVTSHSIPVYLTPVLIRSHLTPVLMTVMLIIYPTILFLKLYIHSQNKCSVLSCVFLLIKVKDKILFLQLTSFLVCFKDVCTLIYIDIVNFHVQYFKNICVYIFLLFLYPWTYILFQIFHCRSPVWREHVWTYFFQNMIKYILELFPRYGGIGHKIAHFQFP